MLRALDGVGGRIIGAVKTTRYFERNVLGDPARGEITAEMCERIVREEEDSEVQGNGLMRFWGYVSELEYYVRVITTGDREWLVNAFKDRNYTRKARRSG